MTYFARFFMFGSLAFIASSALGNVAADGGGRKCSCTCVAKNPPVEIAPPGNDGGEDIGSGPTQCWQKTGNGGWVGAGSCNLEVQADNCNDAANTVGVTRDGNGNITGDGNSCTVSSGPNPPQRNDVGNGTVQCKDITNPVQPVVQPVVTVPVAN